MSSMNYLHFPKSLAWKQQHKKKALFLSILIKKKASNKRSKNGFYKQTNEAGRDQLRRVQGAKVNSLEQRERSPAQTAKEERQTLSRPLPQLIPFVAFP